MAVISITIDDSMIGQIISPGPNQYIELVEKVKDQAPAYQIESFLDAPYPFGLWKSGRFVIRDRGGAGRRLLNFSSQYGSYATVLMTAGQTFGFQGDLVLECLPAGEEWRMDFSDVPPAARQVA